MIPDFIGRQKLKRIPTPGGDVLHALKATDPEFSGFGEAYFSMVEGNAVKAWKKHTAMKMNLVAPIGKIRFVFQDPKDITRFHEEVIGEENYYRLTVAPGIWFGFQGLASPFSLLLNIANMPHDPQEAERRSIEEIPFDWNLLPE